MTFIDDEDKYNWEASKNNEEEDLKQLENDD